MAPSILPWNTVVGCSFAFAIEPGLMIEAPGSAFAGLTGTTLAQMTISSPGVVAFIFYLIRTFSIFDGGLFLFFAIVSATAYRSGERWTWYLTWLVPTLFVVDLPYEFLLRGFLDVSSFVFVAILVTGLLLPYRKFFPKKPLVRAALT